MSVVALPTSRRAQGIEVSPTVAVAQRASELRARGVDVLDFSVGEPDQPTPAHVARAGQDAVAAGHTRYTNTLGLASLREAVAQRYRTDHGLEMRSENVAITLGGKHAVYATCQVLLDPGDEVLVPVPSWPTFAEAARLAGATVVPVATYEENGFRLTAEAVERALTPRTRALFVNSPCNPTGAAVEPGELLEIGELAHARNLALFFDDTYARLWYGPLPAGGPLRELQQRAGEQLVILGTASKTYCMTGWRIGWILGAPSFIKTCGAHFSHSTQCPATFSQVAAVDALTGPQDCVEEMRAEYGRRRELVLAELGRIEGVRCVPPDGAFYVFPNVSARLRGGTALDFCARLLDEERVALVPGEGFGVPGHVRLSFARSRPELREGLQRLGRFMER